MEYRFSNEINEMLRELEAQIMEEYDASKEVGVRVNLMPKSHNTMSQYEKIVDNSKVIAIMFEKLDKLNNDLKSSKLRLEDAKLSGKAEDIEQEENLIVRINALIEKLTIKIENYKKAMLASMKQKINELKSELEKRKARKDERNCKYCSKLENEIEQLEDKIKKLEEHVGEPEQIGKIEPIGDLVLTNVQNTHVDPRFVAIHETTPGMTKKYEQGILTDADDVVRPTKPGRWVRSFDYYDKLIRNQGVTDREGAIARCDEIEAEFAQNRPFGRTIGYHARIDAPGLLGRDEIVILLPATASPDQISNKYMTPYVYGIERCVGEEQDFHKGIAMQAMLTAFVFKQLGYDVETVKKRVFPHNFFTKFKQSCPNRMLYASILLQASKKREITEQEIKDIKEYVPWEVFTNLVTTFFERDKYPEELRRKFIYDMADYDAYMADPEGYNYEERRKNRHVPQTWMYEDSEYQNAIYKTKEEQKKIEKEI